MDNLTHSLIGGALGQAGLKRKTGLAMPALIIAANLPDIDAACLLWLNGMEHVAVRRGITHGPPALLILPLLLAGALWWFDRWQAKRGTRPEGRLPVSFRWLLALCYIGALSHPLFDWFNNYGIRLLEPIAPTWFYGDTLFIFDVWIVAFLSLGIWLSWRRPQRPAKAAARPAQIALVVTMLYVGLNLWISRTAVASYPERIDDGEQLTVANVPPLAFWQRDLLVGSRNDWVRVPFSVVSGYGAPQRISRSGACDIWPDDQTLAALAAKQPELKAFLFWSRMPFVERADGTQGPRLRFRDARFAQWPVADRFTVTVPLTSVSSDCGGRIRQAPPLAPTLPEVRPPSP
jgi:inner membrane protein